MLLPVVGVEGFGARFYDNRLGITNVRADTPEEVESACSGLSLEVEAWYGVRIFSDHWGDDERSDDMSGLLMSEEHAGRTDPYRQLAALTHTIARRT